LWDNNPDDVLLLGGASADISYSLIGGVPGPGNIDSDPAFFPATYHLMPESPCIDAGNDNTASGTLDLLGRGRVLDGNGDQVARRDIGSNEFDHMNVLGDLGALIGEYYRNILDREPDKDGVAFWVSESTRTAAIGIDPAETLRGLGWVFFNSEEYLNRAKTNSDFVEDLYQAYLRRMPSSQEVSYWVGMMNDGLSRNSLIMHFVYSEEFLLLTNTFIGSVPTDPAGNILNDFYRGILRRLPDSVGFQYWLSLISEAACWGIDDLRLVFSEVAHQFIKSPEYNSRKADEFEFVEDLYNAVLRRAPDPAGLQHWVGQLRSGSMTRSNLLEAFLASAEFEKRMLLLTGAGCVK
jgi:hypothetical protein